MENFKVIIVEDDKLELKGTQQILQTEVPEAEIIGTAQGESDFWKLMRDGQPDLVLLDLGLGGSTTVGVDICRQLRTRYADMKILVFTGEILNERLWVEVLSAGADGIILKTGNLLQRDDVVQVMHGRHLVFNEPFLEKVMARFRKIVCREQAAVDAFVEYEIDEYDERFLRHLALGYTKDMIAGLRQMPFSTKSLEKRQVDLTNRLFSERERSGVNAVRLVVLLSWVLSALGVPCRSLLDGEGLRWLCRHAADSLHSRLVMLVLCCLMLLGAVQKSLLPFGQTVRQSRFLRYVAVYLVVLIAILLAAIAPDSPLLSITGGIVGSPLMDGFPFLVWLSFLAFCLCYGHGKRESWMSMLTYGISRHPLAIPFAIVLSFCWQCLQYMNS